MANLPDELIDDILLRLPVKSVLRLRCVCKTWCALIDDNTFVKQHLYHSVETKNNKLTIVFDNYSDKICSLGFNPLADQALELAQPIINPKATSAKVKVVGSCNGLLCLFYESLNDLIVIWNPATRKHVMLPHINTIKHTANNIKSAFHTMYPTLGNSSSGCTVVHGFGYDSVSDDYKVVILVQFFLGDGDILISQSYVYSLRSDSWRVIDDDTDCVMDDPERPDVLVRNMIHWKGTKHDSTRSVVAFDLAIDNYRLVTLPQYHVDDHVLSDSLSELGGCLSIVFCHYMINVFDVWVMKDYGVTESWTKLFTVSSSDTIRFINHLIPLAFSEIGDEVLLMLNSKMFFWYNLEMRSVKFVDVRGIFNFGRRVICLESLVCLGHKAEHDERLGSEHEEAKEEHQEE